MNCVHVDLDKRGPTEKGYFWDGGAAHNTFCQFNPDMRSQRVNTMMSGLVGVEGDLEAADGVCRRSIWCSPDTWLRDFAERKLYLFISCGFTEALQHCLTGVQSHHKEQPLVFQVTVLWEHEVINTQISQLLL